MRESLPDNTSIRRATGVFFLLAMAASITANILLLQAIQREDYLTYIAANPHNVSFSGFFFFINSIAVMAIGVLIYPWLRVRSNLLALTYLVTRIFEAVVLSIGFIALLALNSIAEYSAAGSAPPHQVYALSELMLKINWFAYHSAMVILGLGSIGFCWALYKSPLAPIALTGLGFVGYTVLAVTSGLAIVGYSLGLLVTLPVFLFEVSLGVWWVFKK